MDNVNNFYENFDFSTFFEFLNVDKLKTSFFFDSTAFYKFKQICAFCISLCFFMSKCVILNLQKNKITGIFVGTFFDHP